MPARRPLAPPPNVIGGNPPRVRGVREPVPRHRAAEHGVRGPARRGPECGRGRPARAAVAASAAPAGPESGAESAGSGRAGFGRRVRVSVPGQRSAAESALRLAGVPPPSLRRRRRPPRRPGSGAKSAPPPTPRPLRLTRPRHAAAAHPSDETPAGYVTAASLWPAGAPRPSEADPDAPQSSPPDQAAEAASVAQRSAQGQAGTPATRHSFPAVPRGAVSAAAPAAPPREAAPPNRARIDGRTAAIVAVVVLLAAAVTTAVVVLTGGSEPERAAATGRAVVENAKPEPVATTDALRRTDELDAQVKQLDELMLLSKKGRAAGRQGRHQGRDREPRAAPEGHPAPSTPTPPTRQLKAGAGQLRRRDRGVAAPEPRVRLEVLDRRPRRRSGASSRPR